VSLRPVAWVTVGILVLLLAWFVQRPSAPGISVGPDIRTPTPDSKREFVLAEPTEAHQSESRALEPQLVEPVVPPVLEPRKPFEAWSVEELQAERDRLWASLKAETTPLFFKQVRLGQAERLAEPGEFTYHSRPEDRTDIHGIVSDPELGVFRASLARSQFADLYDAKKRIDDLDAWIETKSRRGR
jgi:hypothetical protein